MSVAALTHQAFISFSSVDRAKANLICDQLEGAGVRCWISLRDVEPGSSFQTSIVAALQAAKIMVLVFSENTNHSQEIQKELALASTFGVAVVPVRIVDARPAGAMLYELATRQWIDAFDDWDRAMRRLTEKAHALLAIDLSKGEVGAPIAGQIAAPTILQSKAATPSPNFSSAELEAARLALAHALGPIADVLVRRSSAKATSLPDLYDRLASHIRNTDDQAAFRRRLESSLRRGKVS